MRHSPRCGALAAAWCRSTVVLAQAPSAAANYPAKLLRLIAGFPAGGPADFFARTLAQKLPENIGQQVVVDNRVGVSGMIAAEHIARSAPADGYAVYFAGTGVLAFAATLYAKRPIDIDKALVPLTPGVTVPEMLMNE